MTSHRPKASQSSEKFEHLHIPTHYTDFCWSDRLEAVMQQEVGIAHTGRGNNISVINQFSIPTYMKNRYLFRLCISMNYSWTKHWGSWLKDLQLHKYLNHILCSTIEISSAVGNVTMTRRGIVKVCVCCGDTSVSGECLRTKEEVLRFLRWSHWGEVTQGNNLGNSVKIYENSE